VDKYELAAKFRELADKAEASQICTGVRMKAGEPICTVHDFLWDATEAVCNGVLNALDEIEREED
jgi:hypothetical protein